MKKILKKYFTVKQAENLLPSVKKRLIKLIEINRVIVLLNTVKVNYEDEFESLSDEIQRNKEKHHASYEFYKDVKALLDLGVIVKNLEEGVVDFYAIHEGKEIFLCWKFGEDKIEFWHEIEDGYMVRQHISALQRNY